MTGGSTLQQVDSQLDLFFSDWSIYTTIIFLSLVSFLLYPIFFSPEPDTHPLLLVCQASASHVRQPGESATFRSLETPEGYPLRSGLSVKIPGAPKWTSGRDGDLRDIWKQATRDPVDVDGKSTGTPGRLLAFLGKEEVIEFGVTQLTSEIIAAGEFLKTHGGSRIAIYLPNSVEFVVTFFASAFFNLTPILIPQGQSSDKLAELLNRTQADVIVAAAGTIPLKELVKHYSGLKQVIWVVERSSRHIDWNEVPEGVGSGTNISAWHDIVGKQNSQSPPELPPDIPSADLSEVTVIYEYQSNGTDNVEIVNFTQKNIVAAVAAQIAALPSTHRFRPADLVLPLDSLSNIWTLTVVLAALYSNSSLALTSVAGHKVDYDTSCQIVMPSIVIASTNIMFTAHQDSKAAATGMGHRLRRWIQARSLAYGVMPRVFSTTPGPRLLYISHRAGVDKVALEAKDILDLRLLTRARIVYAFTAANVAGAITQTNLFDYQTRETSLSKHAHFGPPLSCVELKLEETKDASEDDRPIGRPIVSGPAVVTGKTKLSQTMTVTDSNTLSFA